MRKCVCISTGLILFSVCPLAYSDPSPESGLFIAEKYSGKYDDLEKAGYTIENGISLDIKRKPQALAFAACQPFEKTKPVDCILVVTEITGHDTAGHAIRAIPSEMLHIRFPNEWNYFVTDDAGCKATGYPGANVIAIGKWKWREKPLHGGYADSLKKAWRIDFKSLRLIEIPAQDVSCGFDEDRD